MSVVHRTMSAGGWIAVAVMGALPLGACSPTSSGSGSGGADSSVGGHGGGDGGGLTAGGSGGAGGEAGPPSRFVKLGEVEILPDSGVKGDKTNTAHGSMGVFNCLVPGDAGECAVMEAAIANQDHGATFMIIREDGSYDTVWDGSTKISNWGGPYGLTCFRIAFDAINRRVYCASPTMGDLEKDAALSGVAVLNANSGDLIGQNNASLYSVSGLSSIAVSPGKELTGARNGGGVYRAAIKADGSLEPFVKISDRNDYGLAYTKDGRLVEITDEGQLFVDEVFEHDFQVLPVDVSVTEETVLVPAAWMGVLTYDLVTGESGVIDTYPTQGCIAYSATRGKVKDPVTQEVKDRALVGCSDQGLDVDLEQGTMASLPMRFGATSVHLSGSTAMFLDWRRIELDRIDPSGKNDSFHTHAGETVGPKGGHFWVWNTGEEELIVDSAGGYKLQPGEAKVFPLTAEALPAGGLFVRKREIRILNHDGGIAQKTLGPGDSFLPDHPNATVHYIQKGCSGQLVELRALGACFRQPGCNDALILPPVLASEGEANDFYKFMKNYAGIDVNLHGQHMIKPEVVCPNYDIQQGSQMFEPQCLNAEIGLGDVANVFNTKDYTVGIERNGSEVISVLGQFGLNKPHNGL